MAIKPLSFRWDGDFIQQIDDARDKTPRSAFVREAVESKILRANESGSRQQSETASIPVGPIETDPSSAQEFKQNMDHITRFGLRIQRVKHLPTCSCGTCKP